MTIIEAINTIDALKPNVYTQTEKVKWLSDIDGMIKRTIIDTHEKLEELEEEEFVGYNDDTPMDTVLLVQAPYEDVYMLWLESKIDYCNGEYAKYNNSVTRFNDVYSAYRNDYNKTHMPLGSKNKYF